MKDPRQQFGANVRELRTKTGISQEGLGELSDLDRTYISSVERGLRNVSLLNIVEIARALKARPMDLLKGIE